MYGSFLHDVGKIVYRSKHDYPRMDHSKLGAEYLKIFPKLNEIKGISDSIKYHHKSHIEKANIFNDSVAYITYIADNIASGLDRKTEIEGDGDNNGFKKDIALQSIFNILNGNSEKKTYEFKTNEVINYPSENNIYTQGEYSLIVEEMKAFYDKITFDKNQFNSLLQFAENYWSYIPSSTNLKELQDISLYDHSKITCALASVIYDYLSTNKIEDYNEELFKKSKTFYDKDVFLLLGMDMSGIQEFIYNISGEKALKSLRARSFYLDFLLEYIVDLLLDKLDLSRTNLLYTGGGHAYLLVANTENSIKLIDEFDKDIKKWMLEKFKTDLYLSFGYEKCSGNDLMNSNGNYSKIWSKVSEMIQNKKSNRYEFNDILNLNKGIKLNEVECKECLRNDCDIVDDLCSICNSLINFSSKLQKMSKDEFLVVKKDGDLELPFNTKLSILKKEEVEKIIESEKIKIYTKNNPHLGIFVSTNLWISNYFKEYEIEEYANKAEGVRRLSVLRADIDNLGRTFVLGIPNEYNSISRTATLSRKLSMFFKYGIDKILISKGYLASVVYSGGDDLFIIGAWDDIIDLSLEIKKHFDLYVQKTLTISAGIGMFKPKYPIYKMASETAELENKSKMSNKNKITLWNGENVYSWDLLDGDILNNKFKVIYESLKNSENHGKNFVYNMINLLKSEDKISLARIFYLLSKNKINDELSNIVINSIKSNIKDKKYELITAFEYYIYKTREDS